MAYIKAREILTRLRELTQEGEGVARTINEDRFKGGLHDGLSEDEQSRLGITAKKPIESSIVVVRPHPLQITRVCDQQFKQIDVELKVVRTIEIVGQVDDCVRDEVKALAAEDADALCQLLGWPPNLAVTKCGDSTDLAELNHVDSRAVLSRPNTSAKALRLETIHLFRGTAISRPSAA